jgi:hypothetical protein
MGALPSIPGFRKNSEHELKKKCERLATAISRAGTEKSKATNAEWNVLGGLWASWGRGKFKRAFPDGPYDFEKASNEQALAFVHDLLKAAGENRCAKEDVERLLLFSGLPDTDAITACVLALPTAVELERKIALAKLPNDVAQVQKKVDELVRNYEQLVRSTQSASNTASGAMLVAKDSTDAINSLMSKFVDFERENTEVSNRLCDELSESIEMQAKRFDSHSKRIEKTQHDFEQGVARKLGAFEKSLASVIADMKNIAGEIASVQNNCETLSESVDAATASLKSVPSTEVVVDGATESKTYGTLKLIQLPAETQSLVVVDDTTDLLRVLSSNFAAIGIRHSDAESVARIVLSAALAGTLVQFSGSLADFLGNAAASTLGGRRVLSWTVPLGLSDDVAVDALISRVSADEDASGAVLLRGVNRSAFEIYGTAARDLIVRRLTVKAATSHATPHLFASWAEGPATLPGGSALIELGPVINTDDLVWTGNCKWNQFKVVEGREIPKFVREIKSIDGEETAETLRIVDALGLQNNRLWRIAFSRFVANLFALPGQDFQVALSNVLWAWVLPWAKANNVARVEIEDGIKASAAEQLDAPYVKSALQGLFAEEMM